MQLQATISVWCSPVPMTAAVKIISALYLVTNSTHRGLWPSVMNPSALSLREELLFRAALAFSCIYLLQLSSSRWAGSPPASPSIPACCQLSQIPFSPLPSLRSCPVLHRSWGVLAILELKKPKRIQKEHKLFSHLYLVICLRCHSITETFFPASFFHSTDSLILVILGIHKWKLIQFNMNN